MRKRAAGAALFVVDESRKILDSINIEVITIDYGTFVPRLDFLQ